MKKAIKDYKDAVAAHQGDNANETTATALTKAQKNLNDAVLAFDENTLTESEEEE